MSNKDFKGKSPVEEQNEQNVTNEEATNLQEQSEKKAEEIAEGDNTSDELAALQQKYDELNDTHLRLRAEFDNYRKRTLREKSDLIKSGGENALTNLLPVIDDFERALQNIEKGGRHEGRGRGRRFDLHEVRRLPEEPRREGHGSRRQTV